MLTRLRQLVLHPGLIPVNYLQELQSHAVPEESNAAVMDITPAEKLRLQIKLAQAIEESEECCICLDVMSEPRITTCSHMFCNPCISEVIKRDPKCPMVYFFI